MKVLETVGDGTHTKALEIACDLFWDDYLNCIQAREPGTSILVDRLPLAFQTRATQQSRRWLAVLATVLWKLGQVEVVPPASMAEQLVLGLITDYAARDLPEMHQEDKFPGLDLDGVALDYRDWLGELAGDLDHEMLLNPALDGLGDFSHLGGTSDYDDLFSPFSMGGVPHPMSVPE